MKRERKRILPTWVKLSLIILLLSIVVYICAINNPIFADKINNTVSAAVRSALAKISNLLPFSIFEALIILIPAFLVL